MKENNYDNPGFFSQYRRFPRSVEGLSAAGEWHALREMLPDFTGKRVLDLGCGSGILSVAALLLGAKSAVGVDIDPLAVKTAVENAETNGVAGRFTGICGNLAEKVTGKFQVVAANIVADIVILLSQDAPRFLNPDSTYIVSGIIDTREQDVLAAIQDTFQVIERREEKGWVAMALKLK